MAPKNKSYWQQSVHPLPNNVLDKDISVDVLIIGAGIAGLTIGYNLEKRGIKTAIAEAKYIGFGETGRTTAHISDALDDKYYHLAKLFGIKGARLARQSHRDAINAIKSIIQEEKINCDFEEIPGFLFIDIDHDKLLRKEKKALQKELDSARRAGHFVSFTYQSPLPFISPSLRFENQAQFHPLKYLYGLARAYEKLGGVIYTNTRADDLHVRDGYIVCNGRRAKAANFVFATNTPINTTVKIHAKQAPYNTHVVAYKIPKDSITHALYWDTRDPYHYVRLQVFDSLHDLLIIGGEDRKTGQDKNPVKRYESLHKWAAERFPDAKEIAYKWSGQVMEPSDSLAYIGRTPGEKNSYIITGDSGNGITHGTIAGSIIPDLIEKIENKYSKLYSPSRNALKALNITAKENANVAGQYFKHAKKGDIPSRGMLHVGEGGIVREGFRSIAVYRNEEKICRFSVACPHLGCPVVWNEEEKTFDCTCHGSRFTGDGEVIHGPAISGLKRLDCEKKDS